MLHGEHRQFDADHAPAFARPQATGVDHVFGVDRALVGDDIPGAVGRLNQFFHLGVAQDCRAVDAGRLGIGMGGAGGVRDGLQSGPRALR